MAKLEKQSGKIDLDEAKRIMSIENYHKLITEYKG
jgi:hypothetical protein